MANETALRQLRRAAGLSGTKLAGMVGVERRYIYTLEYRIRQPGARILRRIAEVLAKELQRDIGDILEELTREASPDAD